MRGSPVEKPQRKVWPAEMQNGRGGPETPPASFPSRAAGAQARGLTRRDVVRLTGAGLAALMLPGCGGGGGGGGGPDQTKIWRLSSRGRRTSNAAKIHNANKRFPTAAAALSQRAHPGDGSKVVAIDTSVANWLALFGNGEPCVDIRTLAPALKAIAG